MARKFKELEDKMSAESRARVQARVDRAVAEMPLHQLRQAVKMSQERMAELMEINQSSVSKIEHQADMYVSTLRSYVEALGGTLVIMAKMPTGEVVVRNFDEIREDHNQVGDPSPTTRRKRVTVGG